MTPPETFPTREHLDHETVLDALLVADMRNEAAVAYVGRTARAASLRVSLFAIFGLPLICLIAVGLINLRWPL